ncbi:hypothetical protein N7499_001239 [Penicillium canescens]|uniref:Uncharacterized protein n=1 Tax=Penicillium canescens TaxID=5083 RepID=A0AAD6I2R9_PENCN|nr:uncharacterized protein N7446_003622 [Penicillium canescens]KAJ6027781.1 hypothetical protein N7460_012598 [Penicillium canescens]KAJ6041061.1 hypothetical protein N7444_009966 [Penicillium canescens]KAJ6066585.1 hypothetical protein N7446_003622 [Penicillium canescens]KAJ6101609.1 hypothetical protein N7499_001239 [Penicillium canescens]KAJ6174069.1 hypothetical protein N7485_006881 [Penicillium canescens]
MAFLFAGLSLLATAHAAEVTPVPVPYGCASLPNVQQTGPNSGFAGPWNIIVDQCVNTTAADSACTIEGFRNVARTITVDGQPEAKRGFVGLPMTQYKPMELQKMLIKGFQVSIVNHQYDAMSYIICNIEIGFEAMVFYDNANEYLPINITSNPADALLQWGLAEDESEVIDAYYHYIDGTKQDGIFLGAHNVTSWGVQQQEHIPGTSGGPMWQLRLLGPNSVDQETGEVLKEGEYKTFIRIDA